MNTQLRALSGAFKPSTLLSALLLGALSVPAQAAIATPFLGIPGGTIDLRCPADLEVECATDVPFPAETLKEFLAAGGSLSYSCPGRAALNHVSDVAEGHCPIVITRTYWVNTPCGTATCEQLIIVRDTQAPSFVGLSDGNVECGVPTKITVQGEDNCNRIDFFAELTGGPAWGGSTLTQVGPDSFELTMTTSGYVLITFTVSDGCNKVQQTIRYVTNCDQPATAEGCSHGFWKNHTELWDEDGDTIATVAGFTASTKFNAYFGLTPVQSVLPDSATMLDALKKGGGMPNGSQLARDGVAGLLNLAAGLNYDLPDGVSDAFDLQAAIADAYKSHSFSPISGQLGQANQNEGSFCD